MATSSGAVPGTGARSPRKACRPRPRHGVDGFSPGDLSLAGFEVSTEAGHLRRHRWAPSRCTSSRRGWLGVQQTANTTSWTPLCPRLVRADRGDRRSLQNARNCGARAMSRERR
jgi:hypothetical protein